MVHMKRPKEGDLRHQLVTMSKPQVKNVMLHPSTWSPQNFLKTRREGSAIKGAKSKLGFGSLERMFNKERAKQRRISEREARQRKRRIEGDRKLLLGCCVQCFAVLHSPLKKWQFNDMKRSKHETRIHVQHTNQTWTNANTPAQTANTLIVGKQGNQSNNFKLKLPIEKYQKIWDKTEKHEHHLNKNNKVRLC